MGFFFRKGRRWRWGGGGRWNGHTTTRERVPSRRVCCSFNYNDRCCRKVPSRFLNTGRTRSTDKLARRTGVLARRTGHSPFGAAELPKNCFGCVLNEARPGLRVLGAVRGTRGYQGDAGSLRSPAGSLQPAQTPGGSQSSSRSVWSVAARPVRGGTGRASAPGAGEMPGCPPAALSSSSSPWTESSAHPCLSGSGSPGHLRCCPRPGCDLQPRESPAEGGDGGDWHHQAPPGQSRLSRLPGRGLASSRRLRAFRRRFALD